MKPKFIQYKSITYSEGESLQRSEDFYAWLDTRRTVREFADRPVAREVIENLILCASTAPSGAHKQPWVFCAVSDPSLKKQIRHAAEKEEWRNYHGRMPKEWLEDLEMLGTSWEKPFLETAPWLIVVFEKKYDIVNGKHHKNYYVSESVGIAVGLLIASVHNAGLVTVTHTPSPLGFLSRILNRPPNERPYLLLPVGYPAENAKVPNLVRKSLHDICVFY